MITRFSVKGFKSLKDVDIELGQINYFIGPNGSGKSNFLEALGVLGAAAFGVIDDESLLRRGVRPGLPYLYKTSFKDVRFPLAISFLASSKAAEYGANIFNPLEAPSSAWTFHSESFQSGGKKLPGRGPATAIKNHPNKGQSAALLFDLGRDDPLSHLLSTLQSYVIYTPSTQTLRGIVPDQQQSNPVGFSGGRLAEALESLLKSDEGKRYWSKLWSDLTLLIGWAESIFITDPSKLPLSPSAASGKRVLGFRDKFMAPSRNLLSGYDASEGALYILFMAVLALHPQTPPLFAVDNADHGLNPRLARKLTEYFCTWLLEADQSKQALLTTHNPLVLDGLPLGDDRVRLFVVDRTTAGWTAVHRIALDDKVRDLAAKGWTLSRMWIAGHLGGVPDV